MTTLILLLDAACEARPFNELDFWKVVKRKSLARNASLAQQELPPTCAHTRPHSPSTKADHPPANTGAEATWVGSSSPSTGVHSVAQVPRELAQRQEGIRAQAGLAQHAWICASIQFPFEKSMLF